MLPAMVWTISVEVHSARRGERKEKSDLVLAAIPVRGSDMAVSNGSCISHAGSRPRWWNQGEAPAIESLVARNSNPPARQADEGIVNF